MSDNGSDKATEFFVTGTKTYLDVDDAMAEFRRLVRDQCRVVASKRLDEINRACEMKWTVNDLKDYSWRQTDCFHVGKQIAVENLGGLYFCLELNREDDATICGALVYLWRQRAALAGDLWDRLSNAASDTAYPEGNNLVFERLLSESDGPNFREHLNRAIDDFIAFVSGGGGLKKYLVQGSPLNEPGSEPGGRPA